MSHFAGKCNGVHSYPNIKKPELSSATLYWILFIFLKRNSFKKARKQVVTTKLFMNVLLQFSNENLQISVSEIYLAGTITQFKISFKQNWPRMLLIEVTY